jgi:hypothetical protein
MLFPLILFLCAACGVATQPASQDTVAAFEVPFPKVEDRVAFLAILRDAAHAGGGHLDVASDEDLRETGIAIPLAKMTIHAAAWRGSNDKESWAVVMDQADQFDQVCLFSRGEDETLASRFRLRGCGIFGLGGLTLYRFRSSTAEHYLCEVIW